MAGPITDVEVLKRYGHAEWSTGTGDAAKKGKVSGRIGTLQYFGFTVVDAETDLGALGVDRQVTYGTRKRSRWLGDTTKASVKGGNAVRIEYPSRRGNALGGSPIGLENAETGERWTVQLEGNMGSFIAYLCEKVLPFDIQVYGRTGNKYGAPVLKVASSPFHGAPAPGPHAPQPAPNP